jgi:hypothetical protein
VGGSPTRLGCADRSGEACRAASSQQFEQLSVPGAAMTTDAGDVEDVRPQPHNVPALSFSRIAAEDNVTVRGRSPQSEHD